MVTNKLSLTKNSILNGNITILQPKQGFRIGVDSILLASSVNKYSKCLELGTGSGAILVYLSKRFPDSHILGVEKNIELVKSLSSKRDNYSWRLWEKAIAIYFL